MDERTFTEKRIVGRNAELLEDRISEKEFQEEIFAGYILGEYQGSKDSFEEQFEKEKNFKNRILEEIFQK